MKKIIFIVLAIVIVGAVYAFASCLFMLLWNFVMPHVFHLPALNFWYAAAIVLLLGFIGNAVRK